MIPEDWNTTKSFELNRATEADQFIWLRFKPEALVHHNIPETAYPLRSYLLDELVRRNGNISVTDIIRGLMDWLDCSDHLSAACKTLREIIDRHYPPSQQKYVACEFEMDRFTRSRFRIDLIDVKSPVAIWRTKRRIIAVACRSEIEPDLLTITVPQVLTIKASQSILASTRIICGGPSLDIVTLLRDAANSLHRSEVDIVFPFTNRKSNNFKWIDQQEGPSISLLPPMGKWLAPNQIAALIAIGCGYL